jgi:Arc/MetJ-type ribon-helix-helix transcriptional regulator
MFLPRVKITVSLPLEVVEWLNERVKDGTYANISKGVEQCILNKMHEKGEN